ncbi:MAG: hypothetical protein ACI9V1_002494 [Spirosomataceae bacterium]
MKFHFYSKKPILAILKKLLLFLFIGFYSPLTLVAQGFSVNGKIIDAITEEPLPFVSLSLQNTTIGTSSDFEGNFELYFSTSLADSLVISCMGYANQRVALQKDSTGNIAQTQFLNIRLQSGTIQLSEVVVYAGENPAWELLRRVVKARDENNYKKLEGYEHESYNKVEVDVNKVNAKTQERRITQRINEAVDKMDTLTDDDGKRVLPMFISESVSNYYFRKDPRLSKEIIKKTNVRGIAVTDGTLVSQLIGSTFQQYNFYDNQVNVLDKNFLSPISSNWRAAYEYYLVDSSEVANGDWYYQIEFEPKRKQDLVFTGVMWISSRKNALVRIDATISKEANLNFIERIKIQQELEQVRDVFFPIKNRIVIDVSEISNNSPGLLLKFTNYNSKVKVDFPQEVTFFRSTIELLDDFDKADSTYWQTVRPEPFNAKEQLAYTMIDSIKKVPSVRRLSGLLNIATTGYGKFLPGIDIGPLIHTVAFNNIEGLRSRFGVRTNTAFSKKWVLQGYLAYGFTDKSWKGGADVTRIFSKIPWSSLRVSYKRDLEQVGFHPDDIGYYSLFAASVRWGTLVRPYYEDQVQIEYQREISKGITAKVNFQNRGFDPIYPFAYRITPELENDSEIKSGFRNSTIKTELIFARDQLTIVSDNERLNFGAIKSPTITLSHQVGLKDVLNSSFYFHQLTLKYRHTLNLGYFGKTYYSGEASKIFGTLPYPLLRNHLGNESIFTVINAYNLMDRSEFISDQYVSARYYHDFEGLFFNRLPLIKKLKWRTYTTGKFLFGSLSERNELMTVPLVESGFRTATNLSFTAPYVELSYGISNIFRLFRVEAIHRLTYLENPGARKFGVKIAAEVAL